MRKDVEGEKLLEAELQNVINAADSIESSYESIMESLDDVLLISTWHGILEAVNSAVFRIDDSSLVHMVKRNVIELNEIIRSHE